MTTKFAVFVIVAAAISGCAPSFDGKYPIDSIRLMTDAPRLGEQASETYPLDAWFEIESGGSIRIHAGGVTSTYANAKIQKTDAGFEAVSDGPRGSGHFTWAFEKSESGGLCCLTFTRDGVHYLKMTSKGREAE